MDFLILQRGLWVACLVAQVLLIGAIFQRRIARHYRFFLAYLIVETCAGVVLLQIPVNTPAYARAYGFYEVAIVVLRAGAVAELFERVSAHFPVITRIRFILASILLALTGLVSIAAVRPVSGAWQYPQTWAVYVHQFETTVLAISLVLMWWFLTRFMSLTPTVGGNLAVHWRILTIYFGISGLVALVSTVGGATRLGSLNIAMLVGDLVCFMAWLGGLKQFGETPPPQILSPEEAALRRMLRQTILQSVKETGREQVESVSENPSPWSSIGAAPGEGARARKLNAACRCGTKTASDREPRGNYPRRARRTSKWRDRVE